MKNLAVEFDGTPCAVKAACTVWSGGKSGDYIKGLPIAIRRQVSGHQAVYGEIDVIKSERKSTIQTEPAARSRNIVETQGFCYNGGEHLTIEKEAGAYAHQLSAAMGHPKGARHEERGLAAGRRSYHQHDRQHGKGRAYQHENAAAYLRNAGLRHFRCNCFGAGRGPGAGAAR